ncbi:hypothetical protein X801_07289 [Opisthorchis viverrini]|uniref:Uncharacterized protein n=1 Tax=Opisthorchis viverrini TaxID=6198 RepID=A0A1S8WRJ7_OPIVI|nr:hypothetical protein X801_07289 [Opisthorchis viverrini]
MVHLRARTGKQWILLPTQSERKYKPIYVRNFWVFVFWFALLYGVMAPKVVSDKALKKASKGKVPRVHKKKKRRRKESYAIYIYKILRHRYLLEGYVNHEFLRQQHL